MTAADVEQRIKDEATIAAQAEMIRALRAELATYQVPAQRQPHDHHAGWGVEGSE